MSNSPDKSGPTILVVDDETSIRSVLQAHLAMMGYTVLTAADGEAALDIFHRCSPELIILDVMMPKLNGYQVCKALREVSAVPIIMLTALADVADRVTGLELGADDYVVKPFSVKELEARIRSILRRVQTTSTPPESLTPAVVRFGKLRIDHNKRQVYKAEEQVGVTELEFKLLKLLASQPGVVIPRDQLLQEIWGYYPKFFFDTRVIDVHISRLRNKLETDPRNPEFILTVRGQGYMLSEAGDEA
ncbi:MAG: response regulator [Cyanothece sp. SIO1E1]|nr:response regulator [Cyanothece sp. SIO1E1]